MAKKNIVKLQPKPKPRLGVDFVFPLSQEEEEQEEQQLPHQNLNEGDVLEVWNVVGKLNSQI